MAKKQYTCRHCARVFKRSEHCARHERVHTQEKPFACAYCDRRYARKCVIDPRRPQRSGEAIAMDTDFLLEILSSAMNEHCTLNSIEEHTRMSLALVLALPTVLNHHLRHIRFRP